MKTTSKAIRVRRSRPLLSHTAALVGLLAVSASQALAQSPSPIGPGRPGFDPDRVAFAADPFSLLSTPVVTYDNLATPLGSYLGGFAYDQVADDVQMISGGVFSKATVAYAGFNFDGDETLTLNLYRMDGPPTPGSFGFNTPGSVLYSQTLPIAATDGALLDFVDLTPDVLLPDFLGVGLVFGGVEFNPTGAGSDAGPLLYDPPVIGSSFDDYWLAGFPSPGDPWALYTFGGSPPINLGIRIETVSERVPESATFLTVLISALALVTACRLGRVRRPA